MRSKIRVDGLWYRPVPWMKEGECHGCYFDTSNCQNSTKNKDFCNAGNEFAGMVFIPNTKEAYEKYLHEAVLHKFDNAANNND